MPLAIVAVVALAVVALMSPGMDIRRDNVANYGHYAPKLQARLQPEAVTPGPIKWAIVTTPQFFDAVAAALNPVPMPDRNPRR